MGLRTCAIAFTIGSRIVRPIFSALSSSSSALPEWSRLPPRVPPALPAPAEDVAIIPAGMPMHTRVPSAVSEGILVEPPSPQQLRGPGSRPPSFYPQFPSTPHPGPPRSHQSVYPPPPMPPPVDSTQVVPTAFGSPGGIEPPSLSPHEDIVIQPTTSFPGPIVAPSGSHHVPMDPPRTGQTIRTPRGAPIPIDIESPPAPPFFPPELLPFGSPRGAMTHDRPSRRSRRSPIFAPGSPRSPSRGSPGRPSRSHRSSDSPQRQGRNIFVEEAPVLPRSRRSHRDRQSQSPSPPVFGPQLPQPSVMVRSDSRGRSRHRVPSRGTALDRPRSPLHSRSPSPEPERYPPPHSSRREGSRRPRSPIVFQQPGSILPPMTGFQPPPVMPIAPTGPPVTFVEPPHPRRLHRSHRYHSRTPSPQTPVILDPHGLPRSPPRSGSWDRPRHRRNFLQREGRRRRRSYERPYSRGHSYDDYDDYDAPDRDPRSHHPSRRHERSPGRLRRSSRSRMRSHSYSPEFRRSHRRHGSYAYSDGEPMSPPRTSHRSHRTFISGPVPRSSRRSPSPDVVVTHGEHVGRSYRQPTLILHGDDQSPRRSPLSIAPSHRLSRPPSINVIAPSLRSERIHEWEAPHPLVSALYL